MPSAANVKIEIPISAENNATSDTSTNSITPLRQAITMIEHKIRNLEKRKAKLESYRDLQNTGKDLNSDQKTAVAKYDEVVQTLEFARELAKQFLGIATSSEKEAKKQLRKEATARSQAELAKVREILLVQDALTQMGQENIREDFLCGRNGAATLTDVDLKLLDELYMVVTPKHEPGNAGIFCEQVQSAAEFLTAVVDGKQKEVFGSTYAQIKDVIGKIHESGYFDQVRDPNFVDEVIEQEALPDVVLPEVLNHEPIPAPPEPMPPIESLTINATPPLQSVPLMPPVVVQTTTVEPQLAPEQQLYYQQQPRPITEVLGTGSFFFLQDSELDTPPDQIPSQTFTNQNYAPGPPPPISMPPHFQAYQPNPPQHLQQPPPGNGIIENQDLRDDPHRGHVRQDRNGSRSGNGQNRFMYFRSKE